MIGKPILLLLGDVTVTVVRLVGSEMDGGVFHLGKIANHSLSTIKMTASGGCLETRQCNDCSRDVESTNRDGRLKLANQGLVLLDSSSIQ